MNTEWTADSNAALSLSLGNFHFGADVVERAERVPTVRAYEDKESLAESESHESFSPTFTYPVRSIGLRPTVIAAYPTLQIYGEDEKIYGYKNLKIDVRSRCSPASCLSHGADSLV
jgi:hypothetical protein